MCVSFHNLFKAEHFIRSLVGACLSVSLRRVRLRVHGEEKLNGVKTAFVDIKMDIALFKIWRAGRPDLGFGVQSFHGKPSAIADAFAVFLRRNEKKLQLVGVGYKAEKKGDTLVMNLGYSHPVELKDPEGITTECTSATEIIVKGIDKAVVGNYAANIRAWRRPEPYKGKGIKYADEVIRRKEGKAGAK